MKLTDKDLTKAMDKGFSAGIQIACENSSDILHEINTTIAKGDVSKLKYPLQITAMIEIDTSCKSLMVFAKFKAPRADMVDISEEVAFPMDDPNQPDLPFDGTTDEPEEDQGLYGGEEETDIDLDGGEVELPIDGDDAPPFDDDDLGD